MYLRTFNEEVYCNGATIAKGTVLRVIEKTHYANCRAEYVELLSGSVIRRGYTMSEEKFFPFLIGCIDRLNENSTVRMLEDK